MHKIDHDMISAIKSVLSNGGNWHSGKRYIISNAQYPECFVVSYFDNDSRKDNEVFGYDKKTGNFWISDCNWLTRTTKKLINDCFIATGLPYFVFVSKGRFCIHNTETHLEKVIGDGVVLKDEIENDKYWTKKV